jgi:hypothetical protein
MASSPDELDEQACLMTKNWRTALFGYWKVRSYMRIPHADWPHVLDLIGSFR